MRYEILSYHPAREKLRETKNSTILSFKTTQHYESFYHHPANNPVFAKSICIIECHNLYHSYYHFHTSEQIFKNKNQQNGLQA